MENQDTTQLRLTDTASTESDSRPVIIIPLDLCYGSASNLVEAVRGSLARPPERVTLDLGELRAMDSSGLKPLLEGRRLCEEAGVELALSSVSECVAKVLRMSRFDQLFDIDDTAIRSKTGRARPVTHREFTDWHSCEHVADSDPSLIGTLRESVAKVAMDAGVSDEELCDIRIAVGEALTNAYKHGSPNRGRSKISVRCMSCPESLAVEVRDEGPPFDADAVDDPDPAKMRDHGMGIYLMRQAMDVVEFRSGCPGNMVRMIKWLDPGKRSGEPR